MNKLRFLFAIIGSFFVTITLIAFMNDLIGGNFIRDPIRYFSGFNIISFGPTEPNRISRPPSAESRPDIPQLDYDPLFEELSE
jgi:hypothetical protein